MNRIRTWLYAACLIALALPAIATVDLGIGFDKKSDRPNLFIAWRNTQRILEVELEVKNYGDEQGSGHVVVYILDDEGKVLDSSPGPIGKSILVQLPPAANGGKEGKVIQMHGSKSMNLLIDRLDRANLPYYLKAEIITDQRDANPLNNVGVKTFNVSSKVRPGALHFRDYYFRNTSSQPVKARWKVATSPLPKDWQLSVFPRNNDEVTIAAGDVVQGHALLQTAPRVAEGDHIDILFSAIDVKEGTVFGQSEWFLIYDTSPPEISGLAYSVDKETGLVDVTLTANDIISFIKEASGCRVEYSTDGGVTFSNRILAYLDGNFVGPTRFRGDVGPFAPGTQLTMNVIVEDAVGNSSRRTFETITVGEKTVKNDAQPAGGGR
jgi:hypothetical protein